MIKPATRLDTDRKNPFQLAAAQFVKRAETKGRPEVEVESPEISAPGDAISKDAALNPLYRPKKGLNYFAHRLRCAALAAHPGQGISVAHQCNSSPRHDCFAQFDKGRLGLLQGDAAPGTGRFNSLRPRGHSTRRDNFHNRWSAPPCRQFAPWSRCESSAAARTHAPARPCSGSACER